MKQTIEDIDPAKAEKYLNANIGNRTMRQGLAEKYAADMVAGRWTECLDPIAFYDDGELANGQHRLWAIIESGTTQRFIVVRDLTREAGLNVDTGGTRSIVDNAKISCSDSELSNVLIGVARAIEDGTSSGSRNARSNAEMLDVVAKHREAADWAVHHAPVGRGMRNAVIMAALGRAWYVEKDKDRLANFSQVLAKGFAEGAADSAAIALRNYILNKIQNGVSLGGSALWRDTFLKTQNAIRYFMLGRSLTTIKAIADEAYPLGTSGIKAKTQRGKKDAARAKRLREGR